MTAIFLTHPTDVLSNYYTDEAIAGLRELGEVRFNDKDLSANSARSVSTTRTER